MKIDPGQIECLVFTYKEGLLSPAAHDLKLRAGAVSLEMDVGAGRVRATIDPESLRVECAMRSGAEAPEVLSQSDRADIERRMRDEVLESARHPEIVFTCERLEPAGERVRLPGRLRLHGQERPLALEARREGGRWVAEVALEQPDWGIRPYRALLGALKVKSGVRVRLSVPASPL